MRNAVVCSSWTAGDAARRVSGGAVLRGVVWACAEGTEFWVGALGVDVAILLAFVASQWLPNVLTDGNLVSEDKDVVLQERVSMCGGGTNDLEGGKRLVRSMTVYTFDPVGLGDGVGGEAILFLNEG